MMFQSPSNCCTISISSYNDPIDSQKGLHMTRKHYEKVAQAFREYHLELVKEYGEGEAWTVTKLDTLDDIADILAEIFKADNDRFDASRFKAACIPNEVAVK